MVSVRNRQQACFVFLSRMLFIYFLLLRFRFLCLARRFWRLKTSKNCFISGCDDDLGGHFTGPRAQLHCFTTIKYLIVMRCTGLVASIFSVLLLYLLIWLLLVLQSPLYLQIIVVIQIFWVFYSYQNYNNNWKFHNE